MILLRTEIDLRGINGGFIEVLSKLNFTRKGGILNQIKYLIKNIGDK